MTLSIQLMGPFAVAREGRPVEGFDSDKVRALLAYLAVEVERPHRRESLAGLLWPEMPERSARGNLRTALANLRQVIGDREASPAFLEITRQTLRFNPESDATIDVLRFMQALSLGADAADELTQGVKLYRGEFIQGLSIADSPEFEEWTLLQREHLRQRYLDALKSLADHYEARSEYEQAVEYAQNQLDVEPWLEEAHRQAMRNLALAGSRSAALAQYETCRQALAEGLGVEPSQETEDLHQRIREGEVEPGVAPKKVRGYELRERIGAGSFGVIYRAHQPAVGREVAIKVIRPEYVNDPRFIRRFEAEAQLVARLEHPYIVPLYDYWRDPEGAYLVMRWFRASSLEAALKRGPFKPETALRLVDQIASALAAAHRQGVVHRDLKPANVLLDDGGNGYLSDFGIAVDLEGLVESEDSSGLTGTPGYSSPEQIRGEPAGQASDIYALGVILYELLIAEPPFQTDSAAEQLERHLSERLPLVNEIRSDLSEDVDLVIQKATEKDPAKRYRDSFELSRALRYAITDEKAPSAPVVARNPYKGLRPFEEADAKDFYGREALVEQLVSRLKQGGKFLALVGPSGSGKSSVVRAGLVPALRQGALPGSADWFYVKMFPGPNPLEELEAVLLQIAVNPPASLLEQLEADRQGLKRAIKRALPEERSELVLVIDQFEEAFTLIGDQERRDHFLNSLLAAIEDERGRLRVVVTLRADYYDRPLQHQGFGELMKAGTEVILPMGSAELERAIAGPAEQVGLNYDADLMVSLVGDTLAEPGALPLLQYALTELFENRQNGRLTLDAYRESGGVAGALVSRAEALYQKLDRTGKELTQHIFLRLLSMRKGTEERRRRVNRSELRSLADDPEMVNQIIDAFGDHRLLTFDRDPESRAPTVEIAHEALLKEWERLSGWIDAGREDLILQRRLTTAAAEWLQANRNRGFLLRGARLEQFATWRNATDLILTPTELEFLAESLAAREARQQEEVARQAKETSLERRALNRLRAFVGVLAVGILAAIGLSAVAFNQSQVAQQEARIATARELSSASRAALEIDPMLSILLALQAVGTTREVDGTILPIAEEALHLAVARSRLRSSLSLDGAFCSVLIHPDNRRLILWDCPGGGPGHTSVWDMTSGESVFALPDNAFPVLSSDGQRIATIGPDFENGLDIIASWDAASGKQEWAVELPLTAPVYGFNLDSGWTRAIRLLDTGETEVWDLETASKLFAVGEPGRTTDFSGSFSPDDAWFATGNFDGTVSIWDAETGERLHYLEGHTGPVESLEFSPDGSQLATASGDGTAILWDPNTGQELATLTDHTNELRGLTFSPSGNLLATGGWDRRVIVWDVPASVSSGSGKVHLSLEGHSGIVWGLDFSEDEGLLGSGSMNGEVKVWDVTQGGSAEGAVFVHGEAPGGAVTVSIDLSADGSQLAAANSDPTPKIWDAVTGRLLHTLVGHDDRVEIIALSSDGEFVATAGYDDAIKIWRLETGEELLSIRDFQCGKQDIASCDVAFSPDGATLAAGADDGMLAIMGLSTLLSGPTEISFTDQKLQAAHTDSIIGLAYNLDGTQIATSSWDGTVKLWDAQSKELLHTFAGFEPAFVGSESAAYRSSFSPDGTRLVATSQDGTARVWNIETGETLIVFRGHTSSVWGVDFSPDGLRIATAGMDGTVKLWDAETGESLTTLTGHTSGVSDVAFSPDGTRLYTASVDGTSRVYLLDIDELMAVARQRLSRGFSEEECLQYLHFEECPVEG